MTVGRSRQREREENAADMPERVRRDNPKPAIATKDHIKREPKTFSHAADEC